MFEIAPAKIVLGVALAFSAMVGTARAGAYDTYGVSDEDVADYAKAASSVGSCSAAHHANTDPAHPNDGAQSLLHVAVLYADCGDALRRKHLAPAVIRTNALFLGLTCSALAASTGAAATVSACSSRAAASAAGS